MSKTKNTTADASAKRIDTLSERPTEDWDIVRLRPHAKQAELIGSYSEQEIAELAEDIRVNGLTHSPEVHPDGYLIAGHRRTAAVEKLGWSKVPVIIRHDLAAQGDDAVELYLIRDNLMRTHYHPLKVARLYQRLKTLESSRNRGQKDSIGDLRDQLAKKFNKSGRTLDRYAAVLKTPPAIRQAVERDELSMSAAESIAQLKPAVQQQIADAIASGTPPKDVVAKYLNKPLKKPIRTARPARIGFADFAQALDQYQSALYERVADIQPQDPQLIGHVGVFERSKLLIMRLLNQLDCGREVVPGFEEATT